MLLSPGHHARRRLPGTAEQGWQHNDATMFLLLSRADTRSHKTDTKSAHRICAAVRRIPGQDASRMENATGEPHVVGTSADQQVQRLRRLETSWMWLAAFGADVDSAPCVIEGADGAGHEPGAGSFAPCVAVPGHPDHRHRWNQRSTPGTPSAVFGAGWRVPGSCSGDWRLSGVRVGAADGLMDKQASTNGRIRPRTAIPTRHLKPRPPPATPSPASTAFATPPATPASPPPAPPSLRRRPRRRWPRGARAW